MYAVRLLARRAGALMAMLLVTAFLVWPAAAGAADPARPFGQGRLFEISQPGKAKSHVFGTMHSSHPTVLKLPGPIAQALRDSRTLLVEVVQTPALEETLAREMVLPFGRRLDAIIGAELMAEVVRQARAYGLPGENFGQLRPWAVMFLFGIPPSEIRREAAGQKELDEALQNFALKEGIAVAWLERPEDITRFLSGLPDADQVAMLRVTLKQVPRIEEIYEDIRIAYLAGDLDRLHAMSAELAAGEDARLNDLFERELVDARNERMVAAMMNHLAGGRVFVAVGALHLSGETGILRLLERAGWRVRRVL
jgi:uncharacterized protein YbaP (TraB family)